MAQKEGNSILVRVAKLLRLSIFFSKVKHSFSFLLVSIMLQFMLVFFLASGTICHVIIKFANSLYPDQDLFKSCS